MDFMVFILRLWNKIGILFQNYPIILFLEKLMIYGSSYFLFPYVFLMATFYYYTDMAEEGKKWRKPLSFILLMPGLIMYGIVIFWLKDFNHPKLILIRDCWLYPIM